MSTCFLFWLTLRLSRYFLKRLFNPVSQQIVVFEGLPPHLCSIFILRPPYG